MHAAYIRPGGVSRNISALLRDIVYLQKPLLIER